LAVKVGEQYFHAVFSTPIQMITLNLVSIKVLKIGYKCL